MGSPSRSDLKDLSPFTLYFTYIVCYVYIFLSYILYSIKCAKHRWCVLLSFAHSNIGLSGFIGPAKELAVLGKYFPTFPPITPPSSLS